MEMKAPDFCTKAAALMEDRGKERDRPNGERSMATCVNAFNAMTGHNLTEEDGWLFMVYLKHSRMRGGGFRLDDYEDAVAYEALMAEAASATSEPKFTVSMDFYNAPKRVYPIVEEPAIKPKKTLEDAYDQECTDCATCMNLNCPRR